MKTISWTADASWDEVHQAAGTVYLGSAVRVRTGLRRALANLVRHPILAVRLAISAGSPRDWLALLQWLDTAQVIGAEQVEVRGRRLRLRQPSQRVRSGRVQTPEIGVAMLARNEAAIIADALGPLVEFASKVVVVDDNSVDGTADIARAAGATVVHRAIDGDWAGQMNFATDTLNTSWVLMIDADESPEPALLELFRSIASWNAVDIVLFPILTYVSGETARAPMLWPDYKGRFYRCQIRFSGAVHPQPNGWSRAVYTPASGPYVYHNKDQLRFYKSALSYDEIDPSYHTAEEHRWLQEQVARLERGQPAGDPPSAG